MKQLLSITLEKNEIYYIIFGALLLIILLVFIFIIIAKLRKKKNLKQNNHLINDVIQALGGISNIIGCQAKLSRLQVVLNDYEIVSKDKLVEHGIKGIVKTSKNLTLVVGEMSTDIAKYIEQSKNK